MSFVNSDCLVTKRRQDGHVFRLSCLCLTKDTRDLTWVVDFIDDHFVTSVNSVIGDGKAIDPVLSELLDCVQAVSKPILGVTRWIYDRSKGDLIRERRKL